MTHEDAGHYAAKHSGAALNPVIAARLKKKIKTGRISCLAAHAVACDLNVTPGEVGIAIDLLEARIVQCQLGLFGWSGQQAAGRTPDDVSAPLQQAIQKALVRGRLPCAAAWNIAASWNIPKNSVKNACDRMGIKISTCQLGAFT